MSNPIITLSDFLSWLRRQRASRIVDVETYVRTFDESATCTPTVRITPQEISLSYRNAWTERSSPDDALAALIEKRLPAMPAGELLALAESGEADRLHAAMAATDHLATWKERVA